MSLWALLKPQAPKELANSHADPVATESPDASMAQSAQQSSTNMPTMNSGSGAAPKASRTHVAKRRICGEDASDKNTKKPKLTGDYGGPDFLDAPSLTTQACCVGCQT